MLESVTDKKDFCDLDKRYVYFLSSYLYHIYVGKENISKKPLQDINGPEASPVLVIPEVSDPTDGITNSSANTHPRTGPSPCSNL